MLSIESWIIFIFAIILGSSILYIVDKYKISKRRYIFELQPFLHELRSLFNRGFIDTTKSNNLSKVIINNVQYDIVYKIITSMSTDILNRKSIHKTDYLMIDLDHIGKYIPYRIDSNHLMIGLNLTMDKIRSMR